MIVHLKSSSLIETLLGKLRCSFNKSFWSNINSTEALSFERYDSCVLPTFNFSSVTQLCLTLRDPMNRSTPGLPFHQQLLEFTQTHVHRVGDAIQPSHPVIPFSSYPQSLPASGSFPMSQLFTSGGQSVGVSASASVLPMNIQGWFLLDWLLWSPCKNWLTWVQIFGLGQWFHFSKSQFPGL